MTELNAEQLESIRRLLVDPLRETVKNEIQLSHDRLESAVERLGDHLAGHIQRSEKRLATVEREVGRLRNFRRKVVAIYGVITIVLSTVWSIVRDKCLSKLMGH